MLSDHVNLPSLVATSMGYGFPAYHGPYSVGSVDIEIATADLPPTVRAPPDAQPTISCRIFYPCETPSRWKFERPVYWISNPQYETAQATLNWILNDERKGHRAATLLQQMRGIKLPVHRNAKILTPPKDNDGKWPVTIFSHGLAGSRNAYSFVCGDLASYGTIVIALDHRDGSSPIQYVRATATTERRVVARRDIEHKQEPETWRARDAQLRIRLYEISMIVEALQYLEDGKELQNLDENYSYNRDERVEVLKQFENIMDVKTPGRVTFAGHSFGGATMTQLVKSAYYASERPEELSLLEPTQDAAISKIVTPESPLLLLDPWSLPLVSPDQAWLSERPLPTYADGGPGGSNILVNFSEGFYVWEENLAVIKRVIQPSTEPLESLATTPEVLNRHRSNHSNLREPSPNDSGYASDASSIPKQNLPGDDDQREHSPAGPHIFYAPQSGHSAQSDFDVLFSWLVWMKSRSKDPKRTLELNVRSMAQTMREAGINIGGAVDPDILDTSAGLPKWVSISHELTPENTTDGEKIAVDSGEIGQKVAEESTSELADPVET